MKKSLTLFLASAVTANVTFDNLRNGHINHPIVQVTDFDPETVWHTCESMGVTGVEPLKNCLQNVVDNIKSADEAAGEIAQTSMLNYVTLKYEEIEREAAATAQATLDAEAENKAKEDLAALEAANAEIKRLEELANKLKEETAN